MKKIARLIGLLAVSICTVLLLMACNNAKYAYATVYCYNLDGDPSSCEAQSITIRYYSDYKKELSSVDVVGIDYPTRGGYNFEGYYSDPTGGTYYFNSTMDDSYDMKEIAQKMIDDKKKEIKLEMYARWSERETTLRYIVDSETTLVYSDTDGYKDDNGVLTLSVLPNSPVVFPIAEKEGYDFVGWYAYDTPVSDSNGNPLLGFLMNDSYYEYENGYQIDFKAVFEPKKFTYIFDFDCQGAAEVIKEFSFGSELIAADYPTYTREDGLEILAWSTTPAKSGIQEYDGVVDGPYILYACWGLKVMIDYNIPESTEQVEMIVFECGEIEVDMESFSREGYEIDKFYLDAACTQEVEQNVEAFAGVSLVYAGWRKIIKEVTLNFNTGDAPVKVIFWEDGTISEQINPVMDGFKFIGWYREGNLSGYPVDLKYEDLIDGETLYAGWTY